MSELPSRWLNRLSMRGDEDIGDLLDHIEELHTENKALRHLIETLGYEVRGGKLVKKSMPGDL